MQNNPKLTWQATLLFELLPCQLTKIFKKCKKDIKHSNISFYFLPKKKKKKKKNKTKTKEKKQNTVEVL